MSHLKALGTRVEVRWRSSLPHKIVKYVYGPPIDMCIMHWNLLTIHHQPPTLSQKYSNGWSSISCSVVASAGDKDSLTINSKHSLIQSVLWWPKSCRPRALSCFINSPQFLLWLQKPIFLVLKKCLMKLWVFQDFKRPQRKCLKEILIRWREWASIGLVLPARCALLDWLLKPLNLLQRKSSTKIDGNNQYVPAALFTSQKLFTSIFISLFHSRLLFFLP